MHLPPIGPRIVTQLDESSIEQLLHDVAQQASQSAYLFLPHPASPVTYTAAPHSNPAFVEAVTEFRLETSPTYTIVTPVIGWLADGSASAHPAVRTIVAEFRFAVSQIDPTAYELPVQEYEPAAPAAEPAPSQQPAHPAPAMAPTPAPAPPTWTLLGPAGLRVPLLQHNVLGRKPNPSPALPSARLVSLNDPAKTLSKTHALLEVSDGMGWVTDLKSTNGTQVVSRQSGETTDCRPKRPVEFASGDLLRLGVFEVTVVFE